MSHNHVTHYDPFYNPNDLEDCDEHGVCGIALNDGNVTNDKELVSCKKCIKKFDSADQERETAIQASCDDMQGYVDFMFEERYNCKCGFKGCMDQLEFGQTEDYEAIWKCPDCGEVLDTHKKELITYHGTHSEAKEDS